ncbi:hypothetical protein Tco_0729897 [Tanacetum coccineum]|uniref:Uncharacterized protein n=1 Tax=Tanacetum coccineum TaxID=301880 RepID=A0ABQ4YRC3_9ASTR
MESQVSVKFKTRLGYNAASSTAASPAVESFVNSSEMLENQEYNKSKSDKGYHAVPPPYTGNFIPFKPDLTFMDEIVESENMDVTTIVTPSNVKTVESNHESADVKSNGDAVEPKTVRKNSFRPPVIEDWNSDDDSEVEFIPNVEDKTVRPSTEKIKFVKSARETKIRINPTNSLKRSRVRLWIVPFLRPRAFSWPLCEIVWGRSDILSSYRLTLIFAYFINGLDFRRDPTLNIEDNVSF